MSYLLDQILYLFDLKRFSLEYARCARKIYFLGFASCNGEGMQSISGKELALLYEVQNCEIHIVEEIVDDLGQWKMIVKVPTQAKEYVIETFLGQTKYWKHLHSAVRFLKDNCPDAKKAVLVLQEGSTG